MTSRERNLGLLPLDVLDRVVASLGDDRRDIAAFARVSSACRAAAIRVDEPAARCRDADARLRVEKYMTTEENATWALANGCPSTSETFAKAAAEGNVDVLETLRRRRCPHDARACAPVCTV